MIFRRYLPILLLLFLIAPLPTLGQEATAEATQIVTLPTSGELHVPMQFPLEIASTVYTNPFDPIDIDALGIFQSPSGQQVVIPGFWMQPYEDRCAAPCESEDLRPAGAPVWQVRFTPEEVGTWTYTLQARNRDGLVFIQDGQFDVADSEAPGFIRVGANRRYFQYSNGDPYFPIGHNLNWSWDAGGGVATYQEWLRELSAAGGNFARLYIDNPWFIGLEWEAPAGDYRAAQRAAARLDIILDTAAEYGIALQVVVLWHQALSIYNGPPVLVPDTFDRPDMNADWENNPYNVIYGGPVGGPGFFFTNEQAVELFRRRLRYIVARWGYSPNIFAWELIDKVDRTSGYDAQAAGVWLQNTASYLKQIDQQGHLITAGSAVFDASVASSPLLDFTSGQFYQRRPLETVSDQVTGAVDSIRQNLRTSPVPTLLTAYSLNPWFEPTGEDPLGIHFQDTLWASALSGAGGSAASDWWYTYVIPQDLQRFYTPLAAFTAGVDWPNLDLQPAEAALVTDDYSAYLPVRIDNFNRQFTASPRDVVVHTITPDGVFPPIATVPSYLYGQVYNNQLSQAQIYRVTLPVNSYLEIAVSRVSTQAGARLAVLVDNQNAVDLTLTTGSPNTVVRVPLTAGDHEITLDNLGDDWLEIGYLEIGQLQAPARVLTLRDSTAGVALGWLQHRGYTWEAINEPRQPIQFQYILDRMPPGRYSVEIWDPLLGAVIGEELVRVGANGILTAELAPMDSQLAIRVFRLGDLLATPETPLNQPTELPSPTLEAPETSLPLATNTPRPSDGS
ncbi:MAG: DUF5060 domain-containing protein [Anaerolineae bacterium]|nr:DUF5060 domain-containing protein [Anaerolineae bacterium]